MPTNLFPYVPLWVLLSVVLAPHVFAQGNTLSKNIGPDHHVPIQGSAKFRAYPSSDVPNPLWLAEFDLGELIAGNQVECLVQLKNNTNKTLSLLQLQPTCSCTVAEFEGKELAPAETQTINVKFKAPGFRKEADYQLSFNLLNEKSEVVAVLQMKGTVKGNLYVEKSNPRQVVLTGLNEFSVPVFISKPVTPESLSVELGKGLEDVFAKIEKIDERQCRVKLTLMAAPDFKTTTGSITVTDKVSGVSDRADLAFEPFSPISINPQFFVFRKLEDTRDGDQPYTHECRAILRTHDHEPRAETPRGSGGQTTGPRDIPEVWARVGEHTLAVEVRPLSLGIYRLTIGCREPALEALEQGERVVLKVGHHQKQIDWEFSARRIK